MRDEYVEAWLAAGLGNPVGHAFGGDVDGEHFRYQLFVEWLQPRRIGPSQMQELVALVEQEPDVNVRVSMQRLLIRHATDDALPVLLEIPEQVPYVEEELALRRLDGELTQAEQLELAAYPSKKVQRKLVESDISDSTAELLEVNGMTKAIRNLARSRLGRRGPAA